MTLKTLALCSVLFSQFFSFSSYAQISKPKPVVSSQNPNYGHYGIGKYEANQILVKNFMFNIGLKENSLFEKSGFLTQDLLLKLVSQDIEAKNWITEVNKQIETTAWKKLSKKDKEKELLQVKLAVKIYINDLLSQSQYHKN